MRRLAVLVVLGSPAARAQSIPHAAIGQAARIIAGPPKTNPLDATGFPPRPPRDEELPPPEDESSDFRIVAAGKVRQRGNKIVLSDGVEFEYRGYTVKGRRAEGDLGTSVFVIAGDATIVGKDAIVHGERIEANFAARTYVADESEAQIKPGLSGGNLRGDLYSQARRSYGSALEFVTEDGELTTCDRREPHFHVAARSALVRPGKRAILRDVGIALFGRTIIRIPFLSVPLDDRTFRNLPTVGQSRDEGYWVRQTTGIPLKDNRDFLGVRTDGFTRLGAGFGGDYRYDRPTVRGTASAYWVTGPGMVSQRNVHEQKLSRNLLLAFDNSIDRNNYLTAPGSSVWNTRATLTWRQQDGATTRLGLVRNQNGTENSDSSTQTITFGDEREVGRVRTQTSVDLLTSSNTFGGGTTSQSSSRRQADVRVNARRGFDVGDATLEYQRSIPVGENVGTFGQADRTPVIGFTSDTRRLFGESFGRKVPIQTDLSLGEFSAPTGGGRLTRQIFDARYAKNEGGGRFTVATNARFRQSFYSDDTAQFVLAGGFDARYRFTDDTSANLRYQYLRPEGYTPLPLDQTGRIHNLVSDLSFRPQRDVTLGAQTGFDFNAAKRQAVGWQQLGLRADYRPGRGDTFLLRSLATYDTFQEAWSNVRIDATFRPRGNDVPFLSVGARYDGFSKVWTNANLFLDNLRWGRVRFSATLAYNGLTKRFDAQQYSMIFDLHCAEAVLLFSNYATGFRSGSDVQFFIRLKALPSDTNFGTDRRGAPIGTATGRDL